jgi:hypothetical protein
MSTTCALSNDAAYSDAVGATQDNHTPHGQGGLALTLIERQGCSMANISARWLGHFDYRPVIEPAAVWPRLALAQPGLLWHPVKASKPLSSNLLDQAYSESSRRTERQKAFADQAPEPGHRGSKGALPPLVAAEVSHVPAPFVQSMLAPPRSYKPAEYFLSGKHVPWK